MNIGALPILTKGGQEEQEEQTFLPSVIKLSSVNLRDHDVIQDNQTNSKRQGTSELIELLPSKVQLGLLKATVKELSLSILLLLF